MSGKQYTTIQIDKGFHSVLKKFCVVNNYTISGLTESLLHEFISSSISTSGSLYYV